MNGIHRLFNVFFMKNSAFLGQGNIFNKNSLILQKLLDAIKDPLNVFSETTCQELFRSVLHEARRVPDPKCTCISVRPLLMYPEKKFLLGEVRKKRINKDGSNTRMIWIPGGNLK